jgi:hypothetical protein
MYDNTYFLNPDHCVFYVGGDGGFEYTNLNMSYYCTFGFGMQYNIRNMKFITSRGVETTSKFYFYNNATPGEAAGYFVTTGWHIERGNKPL